MHVSGCNGGSAEWHEKEGAQQTELMLLGLISVADDEGREGQDGKSIESSEIVLQLFDRKILSQPGI